jgi:hypothetical protein
MIATCRRCFEVAVEAVVRDVELCRRRTIGRTVRLIVERVNGLCHAISARELAKAGKSFGASAQRRNRPA